MSHAMAFLLPPARSPAQITNTFGLADRITSVGVFGLSLNIDEAQIRSVASSMLQISREVSHHFPNINAILLGLSKDYGNGTVLVLLLAPAQTKTAGQRRVGIDPGCLQLELCPPGKPAEVIPHRLVCEPSKKLLKRVNFPRA
mmetsp:Transcript_2874/g.6939  ORF Transcript_2874/g.6939 Transcript_2874/m.6939 type:complete len:143 (-) Transcript_2874:317-745(-)